MAKLAAPGETAMDVIVFVVAAATVSVVVPVIPLSEAFMVVEPAATPVAKPLELIVAAAPLEVVQVAVEVTFADEPLLYVAVAVNCSVVPAAMLGFPGDTAIDVRLGVAAACTVRVAVPLMPFTAALTVVEPAATAEAIPEELIVAIAVFAVVQVAVEVTFAVELSLYVAVAVNCSVAPTAMLAVPGDTAIAVRVFVVFVETGVTELPHPVVASTNASETGRQSDWNRSRGRKQGRIDCLTK